MADRDRGAEHEEEDSSEEDQDNDAMDHEEEEFLPDDNDNEGAAASSFSLKCTAIFSILMLLSGIVTQLGAVVESRRPPSEAPKRQLEEQENREWRASLPSAAAWSSFTDTTSTTTAAAAAQASSLQTFYLILAPTISGTDGRQYEFGWQSREDRHLFTLGALERRRQPEQQSGASSGQQQPYSTTTTLEAASIPLAKAWIETNGRAISHKICNFGPMGTVLDFYGLGIVKFVSVQQQRGKRHNHSRRHPITDKVEEVEEAEDEIWYAFKFREIQPGLATLAFLRQLEQEVRTGADSWAVEDFGDVTLEIAKQSGFGQLWRDALSYVTANPEKVQFRVHLEDPQAYVVSSNGQPLPEPPPRTCPQLQYNSLMKQQRLPCW